MAADSGHGGSGPPRESPVGVVGVTFGLLLILVLAASLLRARAERLDGEALLQEWFAAGELPHGLVVASAGRLPGGEEVVRLVSTHAPPEEPLEQPPGETPEEQPGDPEEPREEPPKQPLDEPVIEPAPDAGAAADAPPPGDGEESATESRPFEPVAAADGPVPPLEVTILHYPLAAANRELARLFDTGDEDDERLKHDPRGRRLTWGQVDWDRYRASYALVRTEGDDGFVDSVRVNLSQDGFACALVARWARDQVGALEPVEDLLAVLHPRE